MTEERMIRVTEYSLNFIEEQIRMDPSQKIAYWEELEPAPPKDWAQQMKDLEERNIRLSRFIMDWLGRELDIFPEGALSLEDILPTSDNRRGNTARK